jgi:4'-phosphopantetheinyl transferase
LLSPSEQERAAQFVIDEARRDFIVTRGALREILGKYLKVEPSGIALRQGNHGKPYISGGPALHFNVSHSQGLAALAFSGGEEIGVDIERTRAEFPASEIAERFFSEEEVAEMDALPPEQRNRAFFSCWTRKEAYVKARGGGLRIPLGSFSVKVSGSEEQQILDEEGKEWTIYSFEIAPEFAGAVAVEGKDWQLNFWDYRAGKERI